MKRPDVSRVFLGGVVAAGLLAFGCSDPAISGTDDPGTGTGTGGAPAGGSSSGAPKPGFDFTSPSGTPSGQPPAGGGGAPAVDNQTRCNELKVSFDRTIPAVVLLIDRSGSMSAFYGGGTRWTVMKDTLLNDTQGLIKRNQGEVRFSLMTYTGTGTGGSCPALETVPFALNNYDAIKGVYGPSQPPDGGETPTGESVKAAAAALLADSEPGPKYILLATDGEPDTCETPNPQCGHDGAVSAVQEALGRGVRTFVLGIGESLDTNVGRAHLQAVANAGQGLPVELGAQADALFGSQCKMTMADLKGQYAAAAKQTAPYYTPDNQDGLARDITAILSAVKSCTFTLKGRVDTQQAAGGRVTLDGEALVYNAPNGWRLNGDNVIELTGSACERLKESGKALDVSFPCGAFQPIE